MRYLPFAALLALVLAWGVMPTTVAPTTSTLLGAFLPGWETAPTPLAYQQTYVGACNPAYVLPHRLTQMYGNTPVINIEYPGPIEDILDGSTDQCWRDILSQAPAGSIVVPLAEANGNWVPWYTTPAGFKEAFARIQSLDPGNHVWCWAPDAHGRFRDYEPASYDLYCPSIYEWHASTISGFVSLATGNRPTLVQQFGVTSDHEAWINAVVTEGNNRGWKGVVYFNADKYAIDWSY